MVSNGLTDWTEERTDNGQSISILCLLPGATDMYLKKIVNLCVCFNFCLSYILLFKVNNQEDVMMELDDPDSTVLYSYRRDTDKTKENCSESDYGVKFIIH